MNYQVLSKLFPMVQKPLFIVINPFIPLYHLEVTSVNPVASHHLIPFLHPSLYILKLNKIKYDYNMVYLWVHNFKITNFFMIT